MKPEIVALKLLGYDDQGNEYDLSDCITDDTDAFLSQYIEEWRKED